MDWPEWADNGGSYASYCVHVDEVLASRWAAKWQQAARKHRVPIPLLRVCSGASLSLKFALRSNFSWRVLVSQRAVAKLRCGPILLGHRSGKPSCANSQSCVFCWCSIDHLWAHVFGECPVWAGHRQLVLLSNLSFQGMRPLCCGRFCVFSWLRGVCVVRR